MGNEQSPIHLDEKELKVRTRGGNFIFVGSTTDMFANAVPSKDILTTLNHCYESNTTIFSEDKNKYLFQSKNPRRFLEFKDHTIFEDSVLCTTIETNRWYEKIMGNCPLIEDRVSAMEELSKLGMKTYVTAEPLMDFDLDEMVECIRRCNPVQVNIGKNTFKRVTLPEPTNEKVELLVQELLKFTRVVIKKNAIKNGTKDITMTSDEEKQELVEA